MIYEVNRGQAHWRDGLSYNADNGKHYECFVTLADRNHLKLRGYISMPLLGHTMTWTRQANYR